MNAAAQYGKYLYALHCVVPPQPFVEVILLESFRNASQL
jgi:hypothetical protein